MYFPHSFDRYIGAAPSGAILLGADVDPTTLTPTLQAAYKSRSNVLTSRTCNTNGFPVQRIAVGVRYVGAGTPSAVPIDTYIWDDSLQCWFKVQVTTGITIGINCITFVDVPSLLDFPVTQTGMGLKPVGALEMALVASQPTTHPDGLYQIVAGCDVSNPGI